MSPPDPYWSSAESFAPPRDDAALEVVDPFSPVALTIAGSDPSGGAGLQADLKTFHQMGVYGMAVPALLTVQNTRGVKSAVELEAALVLDQIECAHRDIPADAAKSGALGSAAVVKAVGKWAERAGVPLVVDPVLVSSHGNALGGDGAIKAIRRHLLPTAHLVMPNLQEASLLADIDVQDLPSMERAAKRLAEMGATRVLVTGGHLAGDANDLLWADGRVTIFRSERVESSSTHGTGCTYSAAITALLAAGFLVEEAICIAKDFVTEAIRSAPGLGGGHGPLNHIQGPTVGIGATCDDRLDEEW